MHQSADPQDLPRPLIERFREARRVFALTGAGISAESGLPTYRDEGGLWRDFNPMELASKEGFERDPALCWEWYLERRAHVREVRPNPAHHALARLEQRVDSMLVATQNVDGLHQLAGTRHVEEVHGSLWRTRCMATGREFAEGEVTVEGGPLPPVTPEGHMLRPAIVWFGEFLPTPPLERIDAFLADPPDLALVIGTSALFSYIVSMAAEARRGGAMLVEINLHESPISAFADFVVRAPAGEVLPRLVDGSGEPGPG